MTKRTRERESIFAAVRLIVSSTLVTPIPQIPLRSEIPEADTWDLTHIFKPEKE